MLTRQVEACTHVTRKLTCACSRQCVEKLRSQVCPECRAPIARPGPFPCNVSVVRIVDAMLANASEDTIFLCHLHASPKQTKDLFCLDCRAAICSDCAIFGAHRLHKIERASCLVGETLQSVNHEALAVLTHLADLEKTLQAAAKKTEPRSCSIKGAIALAAASAELAKACEFQSAAPAGHASAAASAAPADRRRDGGDFIAAAAFAVFSAGFAYKQGPKGLGCRTATDENGLAEEGLSWTRPPDRIVMDQTGNNILRAVNPKPHALSRQAEATKLLNDLRRNSETAMRLEKCRLEGFSCDAHLAAVKLRAALDSHNTALVLCLIPHTRSILRAIHQNWALPRIALEPIHVDELASNVHAPHVAAGITGKRQEKDSRPCKGKGQQLLEPSCLDMWRLDQCFKKKADMEESRSSEQPLKKLKKSHEVCASSAQTRKQASAVSALRADASKASNTSDDGPPSANTCSTETTHQDLDVQFRAIVLRFVAQHGLQGRIPLLCIAGLHKPSSVAFDAQGRLLIADCLNNRVEMCSLVPTVRDEADVGAVLAMSGKHTVLRGVPTPISLAINNAARMLTIMTRFDGVMSCRLAGNQLETTKAQRVVAAQRPRNSGVDPDCLPTLMSFDASRDAVAVILKEVEVLRALSRKTTTYHLTKYHLQITDGDNHVRRVTLDYIPGGLAFDTRTGNVIVTKRSDSCATLTTSCSFTNTPANDAMKLLQKCRFNIDNNSQFTISVLSMNFRGLQQPASMLVCTVRIP